MLGFGALPDGALESVLLSVLLVIRDGESRGIGYIAPLLASELPPVVTYPADNISRRRDMLVGDGATGRTPSTSPSAGTDMNTFDMITHSSRASPPSRATHRHRLYQAGRATSNPRAPRAGPTRTCTSAVRTRYLVFVRPVVPHHKAF